MTFDGVQGTPAAPLVDALLMQREERDGGGWSALLPLHAAGPALPGAAVTHALQGLPDTQLLEVGSALGSLYARYLAEARTQALLGTLGVVVILALWLRSPRRVISVSLPLALAVLLILGALALLRVPIGILHLVGLLLVVAVGSNYALFFDLLTEPANEEARAPPAADSDMLASLLLANVTTVLSFGLIALSDLPALSAIGRVVAPGAMLALLLAAAFSAPRRLQT